MKADKELDLSLKCIIYTFFAMSLMGIFTTQSFFSNEHIKYKKCTILAETLPINSNGSVTINNTENNRNVATEIDRCFRLISATHQTDIHKSNILSYSTYILEMEPSVNNKKALPIINVNLSPSIGDYLGLFIVSTVMFSIGLSLPVYHLFGWLDCKFSDKLNKNDLPLKREREITNHKHYEMPKSSQISVENGARYEDIYAGRYERSYLDWCSRANLEPDSPGSQDLWEEEQAKQVEKNYESDEYLESE